MVAITALKPGDVVYDVHSERAGNTTMRRMGCWHVTIVEVHGDHVIASWNGNPARHYGRAAVAKWRRSRPQRQLSTFDRALALAIDARKRQDAERLDPQGESAGPQDNAQGDGA